MITAKPGEKNPMLCHSDKNHNVLTGILETEIQKHKRKKEKKYSGFQNIGSEPQSFNIWKSIQLSARQVYEDRRC